MSCVSFPTSEQREWLRAGRALAGRWLRVRP